MAQEKTAEFLQEAQEELARVPPEVAEKLGFYVYLYCHPQSGVPFYVGKGKGSRVLSHLKLRNDSRKVKMLDDLKAAGKKPRLDILSHDLPSDEVAQLVESAVIDALESEDLTNEVRGWRARLHGRTPLKELVYSYAARPVEITEPTLLIRINRLFDKKMESDALYDATRGVWRLSERREKALYAMAVYQGVVRAVYRITSWHPAGTTQYATRVHENVSREGRWEFEGVEADKPIRDKYVGKSVRKYFGKNVQTPTVYVECPR